MTTNKKLLKKASPKSIVGDVKAIVAKMKNGDTKFLYRVIGIVSGTQVMTTTYGDAIKFKGEFTVQVPGEESFVSPVVYLPSMASDLTANAFGDGESNIEMVWDISVIRDDDLPKGYEYDTQPVMEIKPSDPMAALLDVVSSLKALPAPTPPASTK